MAGKGTQHGQGAQAGDIGVLVCAMLVFLFASSAQAAVITYTDLYTLGMPTGFSSVVPERAVGGQVVGYGSGSATANNPHALIWTSSATSGIDLNPTSGFKVSEAFAASGTQQVGYGVPTDNITNTAHALLWSGTAQCR